MTDPALSAILEAMMLLFFLLTFALGVVASCSAWAPRARRDAREIAYLRRRLATSDDLGRSEAVRALRSVAVDTASKTTLWIGDARALLDLADKLERGESVENC